MFGADTPLVMDALQLVGLAVIAGGAGVWLILRRRKQTKTSAKPTEAENLENRVQVLERIATDRSFDLADEIETLRDAPKTKELN